MRLYSIEDRQAPFVDAYVRSAGANGFDLRLLRPGAERTSAFAKFVSVYQHHSINPVAFELACFRRYFEVLSLTAPGDRFIIADSDLLINLPASRFPRTLAAFDHGLVGSIGVSGGRPEQDISPHFSYWTHTLLKQFVDYLLASYETAPGRLETIFRQRRDQGNPRAAISDMTLLHRFIADTGTAFMNSNCVIDKTYVDHNFSMAETSHERFRMAWGFKAFDADGDGDGIVFSTADGEPLRPAVIHLQARAKIAASDLSTGHFLRARGRLAALSAARRMRTWLS
jgi:hypothetical protein